MLSSADLFSLTLIATGGLYACMLAYFNGLVGTKRSNTRIIWNSEPIIWILTLLLTFSVVFKIVEPGGGEGPGVWYLIGAGNLMVIYIYLVIELARHDLPKIGYWAMAALAAAAVIYTTATIVMGFSSQLMDLDLYKDVLTTLLAAITHILLIVLAFNFLRSLRSSLMKIWMADPNSPERLTAGGIAVTAVGEVSNPEAALSDIGLLSAENPASASLNPGSSIVVDFGIRRIEDHGYRSDLRIVSSNTDQTIAVEVSNDAQNWESCEREDKILSDWDVPYFDSPWRYVRISNTSDQDIKITDVFDLD
tara:strand:- start:28335 stop:29255 length:921 start_codon:yes stop_codon:yes gene_type:complete